MNDARNPGAQFPDDNQENDIAAHALGATDAGERSAVEALAATDPAAAAELAAYRRLVEIMHYSAPPVTAPPALEATLRAALEGAPQVAAAVATPLPRPPASQPVPRGRSWNWLWPAVAASAAVILLLFGLNLWQMGRIATLSAENAALQAQLTDRDALIAQRSAQLTALDQQVAAQAESLDAAQAQAVDLGALLAERTQVLAATIARAGETYDMTPAQPESAAFATVGWFDAGGVGILQASDFPPLAPDMTYQLWLIKDGQRTSGGLFTVSDTGNGTLIFSPPDTLDAFDGMGITPEPAGGSSGPTAPPVVTGSLHEG
ncbi:MAG: anti-sigma factor [Caldilinea sp.]|nr:anti-sigma factor [Caldilinea sp.]